MHLNRIMGWPVACICQGCCCFAGLLVPDIALEETGQVRDIASKYGIELVLLSTPTTRPERAEAIAKVTQGFLYLVSVAGMAAALSA